MKGRAVRKLLLSVLTAVMIVLIRPVPVQADWIQDKFGWWFQEDDGSFPASAWKEINGVWYYFKDTGYMAIGPMVSTMFSIISTAREQWRRMNGLNSGKTGIISTKTVPSQETAGLATFIMWINWEPWCGTSG